MPDQPRRRLSDQERRRWNDLALNMLGGKVNENAEDIQELRLELRAVSRLPAEMAAFRREFEEWKTERREDLIELRERDKQLRADLYRMQERIDSLFERNFREHKRVQTTTEEIQKNTTPSKLDWALKFATIVSFLLIPILAAYVASAH